MTMEEDHMGKDRMAMEVDLVDLKGMKQEDIKMEDMAMEVAMEKVMITTKATSIKGAIMLIKAKRITKATLVEATKAIQVVTIKAM